MLNRKLVFGAWLLTCCASCAFSQYGRPSVTRGVGIDQRLNAPVPLDLFFRDEQNQLVPLRAYLGDRPAVLALVYYRCPNLCNLTLTEMVQSLHRVALEPGRDYSVIAVSIDPSETPALAGQKKAGYAKEFGRASFSQGWHFLTGSQDSISRLANAVGFHYRWDEPTQQFVHASGIMVITPEGKLSRYIYGIRYAPADLRFALVEASQHKIGSVADYVLLFCYHYDPTQGKYSLVIINVLKIAAGATLAALGVLLFLLMRHKGVQHAT